MAETSLEGLTPEAIQGLAVMAKSLSDNPATREGFLRLAKQQDSSLNIPEIDLPEKMNALLAEERGKREALEIRFREEEIRREVVAKRDAIRGKGIDSSEIAAVEKLMTERGIVNHETAAEFYLAQKQMAQPTPPPGGAYQSHTMPKIDAKEFGGNMRSWGKNAAASAFADIRSGKIAV